MDQTTKLSQLRQRVLQVLEMQVNLKIEPPCIISRISKDVSNEIYRLIDHDPRENGGTDHVIVELKLMDDKVFVLKDGISYGIAEDLVDAGIVPEDIVEDFDELPSFTYAEALAA